MVVEPYDNSRQGTVLNSNEVSTGTNICRVVGECCVRESRHIRTHGCIFVVENIYSVH